MLRSLFPLLLIAFWLIGCDATRPNDPTSGDTNRSAPDKTALFDTFGTGFGGSGSFPFHDHVWMDTSDLIQGKFDPYQDRITDFNLSAFTTLSHALQHAKFVTFWLTKGWQENWFDLASIQTLIDQGKIPVFVYWYFGDHLAEAGYLADHKDDYARDVTRVATLLKHLHGTKLLILEPEFNKASVVNHPDTQASFVTTLSHAIDTLRSALPDTYFSLAMMDTGRRNAQTKDPSCGYANCALGDQSEWGRSDAIYTALLDKLDFLSFQQMVGQFSRDPADPGSWSSPHPKAYTEREIGIDSLPERLDNLAAYLKAHYHKPVYLAYLAIATATWHDTNHDHILQADEVNATGWEAKASEFYGRYAHRDLFGYSVMALFDDPGHDKGGYQFFMEDEYHLGIVKSRTIGTQITGEIQGKGTILESVFR